jgi:Protein of unknown function (DUF3775)
MPNQLSTLTVDQVEALIRLAEKKAARAAAGMVLNLRIPEWQQIIEFVDSLSLDAKKELIALMWLGQGLVGVRVSRWMELIQKASRELRADMALQLAMKPGLHICLRTGLAMMGNPDRPLSL